MNREALLEKWNKKTPVLDHGFIRLVDVMGSPTADLAVLEAARTSTAAESKGEEADRNLIRFLLRNHHATPFEAAVVKVHVKLPIFVERQWVRHRACIAGDVAIYFDHPVAVGNGRARLYTLTMRELWERWQPSTNESRPDKQRNPHFKRNRVQEMHLRSINEETGAVCHTRILDVWESGRKAVQRVVFEDGSCLRATGTHRCFTDQGWMTLHEAITQNARFAGCGKADAPRRELMPLSPAEIAAEEWRPVPGYEDRYDVSNLGRVRSWVNTRGRRLPIAKLKAPTVVHSRGGYLGVSLSLEGKSRLYLVHRLVLDAFDRLREEGEEARHLNSCVLDNRLSNLLWGTPTQNTADRLAHGGGQLLSRKWLRVVETHPDGEEMTYDLAVEGPFHNFIAGGVVVHNSGHNEVSARYQPLPAEYYVPDASRVQLQSVDNRQGSGDVADDDTVKAFLHDMQHMQASEHAQYKRHLGMGISREIARIPLSVGTYTEKIWWCNLRMLLHFMGLRKHEHAQWEIRQYADVIWDMLQDWAPMTAEAFDDYTLGAHTFSRQEMECLQVLLSWDTPPTALGRKELAIVHNLGSMRERKAFWTALGLLK